MRRLSPVLVIGTLAFLAAGCPAGADASNFHDTDWADVRRSDSYCAEPKASVDYYDLNNDDHDEAFVTLWCTGKDEQKGQVFEVVLGTANVEQTHPVKLETHAGAVVNLLCFRNRFAYYRTTRGGTPTMWRVGWSDKTNTVGDPAAVSSTGCV